MSDQNLNAAQLQRAESKAEFLFNLLSDLVADNDATHPTAWEGSYAQGRIKDLLAWIEEPATEDVI